jgi:membrane associated rhomboid family serine protease
MFFIIPYHVDVPMRCRPWMNWVLIGITVLFYPLCISSHGLTQLGRTLMLGGDSWLGAVGHVLVHGGPIHLLGNMLFLWVFGNAVCAKVGNLAYPFIYFGLGLASGLTSYAIGHHPLIGASGAINGIVGMYVVWYLWNDISCWYLYWFFYSGDGGSFSVSSYWMVLLWFMFDLWGAMGGRDGVAYSAHIAGLLFGIGLATLLLVTRLIEMEQGERSLLQVIKGEEATPKKKKRRRRPRTFGDSEPTSRPSRANEKTDDAQ